MKHPAAAACLLGLCIWPAFGAEMARPRSGPVEILGVMKNVWGPRQDIILGKMGSKAARTSVAAGISGSPVYYDGKLLGAVSLRIGAFSPDAICGITPIELMLEINDLDQTRPADAKIPERAAAARSGVLASAGRVWSSSLISSISSIGVMPQMASGEKAPMRSETAPISLPS